MEKYQIKEVINTDAAISPTTAKENVYPIMNEALISKKDIELDFSVIQYSVTDFFNASYGLLFKDFSKDLIEKYIKFSHLKESTKIQIEQVKEGAIQFYRKDKNEQIKDRKF